MCLPYLLLTLCWVWGPTPARTSATAEISISAPLSAHALPLGASWAVLRAAPEPRPASAHQPLGPAPAIGAGLLSTERATQSLPVLGCSSTTPPPPRSCSSAGRGASSTKLPRNARGSVAAVVARQAARVSTERSILSERVRLDRGVSQSATGENADPAGHMVHPPSCRPGSVSK